MWELCSKNSYHRKGEYCPNSCHTNLSLHRSWVKALPTNNFLKWPILKPQLPLWLLLKPGKPRRKYTGLYIRQRNAPCTGLGIKSTYWELCFLKLRTKYFILVLPLAESMWNLHFVSESSSFLQRLHFSPTHVPQIPHLPTESKTLPYATSNMDLRQWLQDDTCDS